MPHARPTSPAEHGGRSLDDKGRNWGMNSKGSKPRHTEGALWKHVPELAGSSAFILYLADVASDRLTLTQAAFFLLAATADAAGKPATRSALLQTYHESFRGSIRNSYRQLLSPSKNYPKGLGWLEAEDNPDDLREQFLRLSPEGKSVIEGALLALEPIFATKNARAN